MVQYLVNKRKQRLRTSKLMLFLSLLLGVGAGTAGYFLPDGRQSGFLYLGAAAMAVIFVISLLTLIVSSSSSPDRRFQADLGEIHGNEKLERTFEEELARPYNIQADKALLSDRWLVYEKRKGRRAIAVRHILWVYRSDQGVSDTVSTDHNLMLVTATREIHEIRFSSAKSLTLFIMGIHRLVPWIFFGYSKSTARGYNQNFEVFKGEVEESRKLYLLDHPGFVSTLYTGNNR